jgi:ParB family transcriptional regulator, chromosome partitioning protein
MTKRKALGKGLGALIPRVTPEDQRDRVHRVDISQIKPNPDQPRKRFDGESLDELAASIRKQGILQPLVVRKHGADYQIIVGERRWRAAQRAGLEQVPVLVYETDDAHMTILALVENIQREDLNPLEEARAYQLMIDNLGLTQEQVAEGVGKSRATVTNTLRLLKLHDDVKKRLLNNEIEMGHARALLSLSDTIAQRELCREVIRAGMTVRQVEARVKKMQKPGRKQNAPRKRDPFVRDAEERLARSLQAPVQIKQGRKGGKIEIKYSSGDDLQRLFDVLTQ